MGTTKIDNLLARLANRDILILDGALGTELERMRAISSSPIWSAEVIGKRDDLLLSIHKEYINSGADIITTGTFRTTRRAFSKVGRLGDFEEVTIKAVELAKKAVAESTVTKDVFIAGSLAPLEDCYSPNLVPSEKECIEEHEIQAQILVRAGVDIILCETFNAVKEGIAALKSAKKQNIPVFLSFTCTPYGDILSGDNFSDLISALGNLTPDCLMVNCTPTQVLHIPLESLRSVWQGPIGAYGNVGASELQRWEFSAEISASSYLEYAKKWIGMGAQVIGGCCGTNPDYIRHLFYHLPEKLPPAV